MDSLTESLSRALDWSQGSPSFFQILVAMGVSYLGGVLASLTPCVYPMIPITIGVVGGLSDTQPGTVKRHWKSVAIRALVYVLGMAVVYAFLGVLAGLTGRVFGSFTNTSGWYLTLGLILSFAAILMLEIVRFDPLAWWGAIQYKLRRGRPSPAQNQAKEEMTWLGAFGLGASSGLIAAPCTTPVLTAVLAFIAKTQSVGMGLVLMLSFSLGLGTLLLAIAFSAGLLQQLPRSGNWMKLLKTLSGLVLLGMAEYLIYRAGQMGGQ